MRLSFVSTALLSVLPSGFAALDRDEVILSLSSRNEHVNRDLLSCVEPSDVYKCSSAVDDDSTCKDH